MSIYLGTTPVAVNSSSREIGEIILSTIPLTDAGLHLLDGGVISGSGAYSAFVTYIAGLVSGHSELFTTEANWQTSVTNYGVCGKFVYDSVNNTVRLPKYSNNHGALIKSYSSGTDWYRIYADGWCEQGGNFGSAYQSYTVKTINLLKNYSSLNYNITAQDAYLASGTYQTNCVIINKTQSSFTLRDTINASGWGNWQACGYIDISDLQQSPIYEYICIATYPKTQIEVDIDEIATDLNGKADTDLSNMNPTQTVKNTIVGWGMPDFSAGVSKTKANGSISGKGYLLFTTNQNVDTCNITIGTTVFKIGGNYNTLDTLFVPVDNNSYSCSNWSIINTLVFIPLKGV